MKRPLRLKTFRLDLSALYGTPGYTLGSPGSLERAKADSIIRGMWNCGGPPPLAANEKYLLPGTLQFDRVAAQESYYLLQSDSYTLHQNRAYIADIINGGVVVDVGCGNSEKLKDFISKISESQQPEHVFSVDIVPGNLNASNKNYESIGYKKGREKRGTTGVLGDMRDPDTFRQIARSIGTTAGAKPITVFVLGGTLNNFPAPEVKKILSNFWELSQQNITGITSWDNTDDYQTLRAAYDTYPLKQWALATVEFFMRSHATLTCPFDVANANAQVDISKRGGFKHVILSAEDDNYEGRFNSIRKISVGETQDQLFRARHALIDRLSFDNHLRFPHADPALYITKPHRFLLSPGYS